MQYFMTYNHILCLFHTDRDADIQSSADRRNAAQVAIEGPEKWGWFGTK